MELYLVRHTAPAVASGICYGHAEVDLHENAATEFEIVRGKFADLVPAAFYTSPLLRCRRLAAALSWGDARQDDRLKEMHFGEWELQRWDAIPREIFDHWATHFVEHAPPGGESFRELYARATGFFADAAEQHPDATVVAVTHAGVIRALLAHALNLSLQHAPGFRLDFGGVTKLVADGTHINVAFVNR
ncbi:MAG: alpha-ribazole phosphatase [Methylobacillus sp.]|jgi:alpha-ribazole phosphatase|nr:alpha-ribazole phosphatase [Methylobacillus sp.]